MLKKKIIVSVILTLFVSLAAMAQPANDNACNASELIVDDGAASSVNTDATVEASEVVPPDGDCAISWCDGNDAENSVWWYFVAPSNGAVVITTCIAGTEFDTQIAVWATADCGDFSTYSLMGANDDMPDDCQDGDQFASTLSVDGLIPGGTYYIQLDGYDAESGAYLISASTGVPSTFINFVHNSADQTIGTIDIRMNGALVADDLEFQTCSQYLEVPAGEDIFIAVCNATSIDDTDPLYSMTQDLSAVSNYVIITHGIHAASGYSPSTPLALAVYQDALAQPSSAILNDVLFFHGSTDAPTVDIEITELGNTTIIDDMSSGSYASEGYVQVATENYTFEVTDEDGNSLGISVCVPFALFGESIAATFVASGFLNPGDNSNGSPLGIYFVNHFDGSFVQLENGGCPIPDNDLPCDATTIVVNAPPIVSTNLFASTDDDEITPPNLDVNDPEADCLNAWCDGLLDGTVWYQFQAPASGNVVVNTCLDVTFDTQIAVYTVSNCADYSSFTLVAANDDTDGGCDNGDTYASTLSVSGLTSGQNYYIQMDGWEGSVGEFEIEVTEVVSVNELYGANIELFPNPASDIIQLKGLNEPAIVKIFDVTGKCAMNFTIKGNTSIDISALPQGIYMLDLSNGPESITKKIVIE